MMKDRSSKRLSIPSIAEGITILLKQGIYRLSETIFLRPEDSGTEQSPTLITSAPGEEVTLSGGMQVKGWKKATENIPGLPKEARGKVWVANVPELGG